MNLFETINEEIKAMLAKDKVRLEALRESRRILEARAAKGAHNELSNETAVVILQKMAKQRRDSADIYLSQNRDDLAETELAQLNVIQEFCLHKCLRKNWKRKLKNYCRNGSNFHERYG